MKPIAPDRLPQDWLRFIAAWGLGLAGLTAALPAPAASTAPSAMRLAPSPRLRTSGARG